MNKKKKMANHDNEKEKIESKPNPRTSKERKCEQKKRGRKKIGRKIWKKKEKEK